MCFNIMFKEMSNFGLKVYAVPLATEMSLDGRLILAVVLNIMKMNIINVLLKVMGDDGDILRLITQR